MGSPYSTHSDTNVSSENGRNRNFIWGAATVRGWRKEQEDRYKAVMNITPDYSYFAVFDGHGGFEVAEYLRMRFHQFIKDYLCRYDMELALQLSFVDFDATLRHPSSIYALNRMVEEAGGNSAAANILRRGGMREALGMIQGSSSVGSESSSGVPRSSNQGSSAMSVESQSGGDLPSSGHASTSKQEAKEQTTSPDGTSQPAAVASRDDPCSSADKGVAQPLQYLLNDDLASSDSEDSDYDVEDEESLSEDDVEEINSEAFMRQQPGDLSGSTATVVLVGNKKVHVANIGDSRCVLSRNGQAVDLTIDHNLDNPQEITRVTNAGATISEDGRVNGTINISRAFGDFNQKGSSDVPAEQAVIAEPSVESVKIENYDDFVIVASDGIWNSFTSQALVDFVGQRIAARDATLMDICSEVFHLVIPEHFRDDGIGCDNLTMIIIKLNAGEEHAYLYAEPAIEIDDASEEEDEATLMEIEYYEKQTDSS